MHNATSISSEAVKAPQAHTWPVTVLLDDQTAEPPARRSRLYEGLREQLDIDSLASLKRALARMQASLEAGLHAVVLLDYELGYALQDMGPNSQSPDKPFSQILLFDNVKLLDGNEVNQWLQSQAGNATATLTGWRNHIDPEGFTEAIEEIRQRIADGQTYQVNYCYAVTMALHGSPVTLYRELRKSQSVPYGALIGLSDGRWVLSRSPELFLQHRNGWVEAKPMKGTAASDSGVNLAQDPKNRAENVMIVDLLRNDLGRLAIPGSVSVPEKFEVRDYGNVRQMTSTVRARLRPDIGWPELLEAVFPCGSITGAPKRSTMQIIQRLEARPRGLYTGAIGWVNPCEPGHLSEFCLSVPIRTLTLSAPSPNGQREGTLGVGAGITWNSNACDEWKECELKSSFLQRLVAPVTLFETMRAHQRLGIAHLERHLARLQQSAQTLNFPLDLDQARQQLRQTCESLADDGDYRVRLDLANDGAISIQSSRLEPLDTPVKVMIATQTMDSSDLFLRHKTSNRAVYDAAWRQAQAQGAFDKLFFNERDELTEGGRSNVFVKLDGRWYTPPLRAGVLPGIMRSILLEDVELDARERIITRRELRQAQAVLVCNALRGALPAQLMY